MENVIPVEKNERGDAFSMRLQQFAIDTSNTTLAKICVDWNLDGMFTRIYIEKFQQVRDFINILTQPNGEERINRMTRENVFQNDKFYFATLTLATNIVTYCHRRNMVHAHEMQNFSTWYYNEGIELVGRQTTYYPSDDELYDSN